VLRAGVEHLPRVAGEQPAVHDRPEVARDDQLDPGETAQVPPTELRGVPVSLRPRRGQVGQRPFGP